MDSLMEQFLGRKAYLKLTWQNLADRVHKDLSTVQKQLSANANPSLSVLQEYAAALDAEIVLMSDDARYDYHNSGVPRAQKNLADMDGELEKLKTKLDEKDALIERMNSTNTALRTNIDLLIQSNRNLSETNAQLVTMLKTKG